MFRQVLEVFSDLYDATTACALAAESSPVGTVRRAFLDGARRELSSADAALAGRRRDEAAQLARSAVGLLRDAVAAGPGDATLDLADLRTADGAIDLRAVDLAVVAHDLAADVAVRIAGLPRS